MAFPVGTDSSGNQRIILVLRRPRGLPYLQVSCALGAYLSTVSARVGAW